MDSIHIPEEPGDKIVVEGKAVDNSVGQAYRDAARIGFDPPGRSGFSGWMEENKRRNLVGVACVCLGMLGMSVNDAAAKWLVLQGYSPFQVMAMRGLLGTAMVLAWVAASGRWEVVKTRRWGAHGFRILVNFIGPVFLFFALATMPLADVTVVLFSTAFITAALSVPIFRQRIDAHRWGAIGVGFLGVVVALKPGAGMFQPAVAFAFLAALSFAGTNLTARWLGDTESTLRIVFFTMVGSAVLGSLFLPFYGKPVLPSDLAVFVLMTAASIVGYAFVTKAFVMAPVGLVAPFEYTILIWAVLFGFLIWGDLPGGFVWGGALVVIASGLYLVHREARRKQG